MLNRPHGWLYYCHHILTPIDNIKLFLAPLKGIPIFIFVSRPLSDRKPTLPPGKKKRNPQEKTNSNLNQKEPKAIVPCF